MNIEEARLVMQKDKDNRGFSAFWDAYDNYCAEYCEETGIAFVKGKWDFRDEKTYIPDEVWNYLLEGFEEAWLNNIMDSNTDKDGDPVVLGDVGKEVDRS